MNKLTSKELFPTSVKEIIQSQKLIGIRLSGGADSAVLLLATLKQFPGIKILPITFFNVLRPNALLAVKNILSYANTRFPESIIGHETSYFDSTDFIPEKFTPCLTNPKDILQRKFIPEVFEKYKGNLKFLLSGATLNPPVENQKMFRLYPGNSFMETRNHKVSSLLRPFKFLGEKLDFAYEYSPFRNSTKQEVAALAKELDLVETLVLPLTESCETPVDKYTKYAVWSGINYERPSVEPCQVCWPCAEKYWAYGYFDYNTTLK